ncbi:PRC-barrel domain-containing protein [Christensenellaceae bacterium OttesenSCG-928-K19]|nr:PRC-barrel domain-containing protein [Christensenellaceae bacterium OttesenSCG-928-K19]
MKKSSEVLGLKVMGVKEGVENGIAHDFMIDPESRNVKYLMLKTDTGYGFRALETTDIIGVGADYIMTGSVENAKKMYESPELLEEIEKGFYMLGTMMLTNEGDVIGRVQDFVFEEKGGEIFTILLDNGEEYSADVITSLAGGIVVVDLDAQVAAVAPAEEEQPVAVPEMTPVEDVMEAAIGDSIAEVEMPEPMDAVVEEEAGSALEEESAAFLLGKTVKNEVVSDDGVFKLAAGTVLTQEIINLAKKHDVILTLTLNV